jgi:hypothetical protein
MHTHKNDKMVGWIEILSYLALMLDSINLEDLLNRIDEDVASETLAALATS